MSSHNIITEKVGFYAKMKHSSISGYKDCIDKFSENFENEVSLKTKTKIFLDTNILLRYYSISFTARAKLFNFLRENKDRIILTPQVQLEFLRNREDIIQRFFEQVTSKIPKDFSTDIVNKMKAFLDQHKVVLKDYPFVEPGIEKYQNELEALLKKLNDAVEEKKTEHVDLLVKDDFLALLSSCLTCDGLNDEEVKIVKSKFDFLSKDVSVNNIESFFNKPNGSFPGLGDIKNKPDDPYGDFIIFHEIMKYMIEEKCDSIFLTFDNTKGDWMNKNKSPHLHYVQNIYANTEKMLYIVNAERALEDLLNIDIDSLIAVESNSLYMPITPETLLEFAKNHSAFRGASIVNYDDSILRELSINGYKYINEIERDIDRVKIGISEYRKDKPHLNSIGILRCGLRIANPLCNKTVLKSGRLSEVDINSYEPYRYFDNS